jgi:hypothetical protein
LTAGVAILVFNFENQSKLIHGAGFSQFELSAHVTNCQVVDTGILLGTFDVIWTLKSLLLSNRLLLILRQNLKKYESSQTLCFIHTVMRTNCPP